MNGELWKLKEEVKKQPRKTWLVALGGTIGVMLICGATYSLLARVKPPASPAPVFAPGKPRGLTIFDGKVTFAVGPIQTIDLRVPCSGLMTISLSFQESATFSTFLVTAEEREKMKARETFAHVQGFDARTSSGSYQQAKELAPGRYSLILLDENISRSTVEVKAHLSDLR